MVQTFVEGVSHIDACWLDGDSLVEKVDDLLDIGGTQNVDALHDGGLTSILNRKNHPLLLVFAGFQGDGQCTTNRLQRTIQRQLSNDIVVL